VVESDTFKIYLHFYRGDKMLKLDIYLYISVHWYIKQDCLSQHQFYTGATSFSQMMFSQMWLAHQHLPNFQKIPWFQIFFPEYKFPKTNVNKQVRFGKGSPARKVSLGFGQKLHYGWKCHTMHDKPTIPICITLYW